MYVIFFNIVYKGGYQTSDTFEGILMANLGFIAVLLFLGSVTVKVKGVGIDSNTQYIDAYDLVRPAQETNALFIGTHRSIVNGQTMTTCTGMDDSVSDTTTRNELCSEDKTCPKDVYVCIYFFLLLPATLPMEKLLEYARSILMEMAKTTAMFMAGVHWRTKPKNL